MLDPLNFEIILNDFKPLATHKSAASTDDCYMLVTIAAKAVGVGLMEEEDIDTDAKGSHNVFGEGDHEQLS
ncbi:hypothetical protein CVT25_013231 [Psilocybe cyanescens]|uniref:Uncharacterized protein n=1 Tax=Psilocybe cyanescens TaxID=93625 RepID=A0A409X0J0_PSICY|nr:hypothetical protein CVT25_013231 [Psilocybe cyanescens]